MRNQEPRRIAARRQRALVATPLDDQRPIILEAGTADQVPHGDARPRPPRTRRRARQQRSPAAHLQPAAPSREDSPWHA